LTKRKHPKKEKGIDSSKKGWRFSRWSTGTGSLDAGRKFPADPLCLLTSLPSQSVSSGKGPKILFCFPALIGEPIISKDIQNFPPRTLKKVIICSLY